MRKNLNWIVLGALVGGFCLREFLAILFCFACVALAGGATTASEYSVKQGDTLWGIARRHKISYERLCELNNKPTDWNMIKVGQEIMVSPALPRSSEERLASFGTPYAAEPTDARLLNVYGDFALFSGETEADVAANQSDENTWHRNSLFLRRRTTNGKTGWRLILTSGSDWKDADGMGEWGKMRASDVRSCYNVVNASLSKDGRYIWMVCNPSCSFWWNIVCRFDLRENALAVLIDGDSADEQPDGTILITGKKSYPSPDDGLGAIWRDVWINPKGEIVRNGEITLRGSEF
ncbi:MAG: LysM peptidoglycan-binding domain-containing protein [Kiritimatiellae bacterium]|nr:LysM peptidoglycan-binding domain-containing protein [Kiritimatiellia bacterium]